MAHELHEHDSMFSVKERPWHGLGQVLEQAPTIAEGIQAANLDWQVTTEPLFTSANESVDARAVRRVDTNHILGVVGTQYQPLQNLDAFRFFQPFLDEGLATLETAGSLFNGAKVFVLAKINSPDAVIVPQSDDRIEKYVLLSNSHDGKNAVRVGYTPIRVVCNNTLRMAKEHKDSALIRVKHSSKTVTTLDTIRETMNLVNQSFEATAAQYRKLAQTDVIMDDVKKYFLEVFDLVPEGDAKRRSGTIEQLEELFHYGRGNHLEGVKGTAWAAYNAATEYMQFYSGRSLESRFGSMWFGPNQSRNDKALALALKL